MKDKIIQGGWSCFVFSIVMFLVEAGLFLVYKDQSSGQGFDRSSPGSGIGIVVALAIEFFIGVLVLGWLGTMAGKFLQRNYARIPAALLPYGLAGYLTLPIPPVLLWWFVGH